LLFPLATVATPNSEEARLLAPEADNLEACGQELLDTSYHGSGCTLAAAIAGLLGQGLEVFTAVHEAQEYTWEALRQGYRLGMGQFLPNRLFWAREEE